MLQVTGVTMKFGGVVALSDVTLDMRIGEIHALIGPNGSGKSTLINVICGIYSPDAGTVKIDGQDITGMPRYQRIRHGVARTFQNLRYARNMTVLDNVLTGMHCHLSGGIFSCGLALPGTVKADKRAQEEGRALLDEVGLAHRAKTLAGTLSHGELKRMEMARALASSPKALLLDEPVAGLGEAERDEMMHAVRDVIKAGKTGIMLVEHSMRTVMAISHRISVLDHGVKIAEGTPAEIQANELVISAYLGERVKT